MKLLKRTLCLMLVLLMVGSLCACGSNNSSNSKPVEKSEEELVRDAVETQRLFEYRFITIGGNEIQSANITITNIKKVSETEYLVNGKIVMNDVYGTQWNNTFDCTVKKSNGSWSANSYEYKSDSWRKG